MRNGKVLIALTLAAVAMAGALSSAHAQLAQSGAAPAAQGSGQDPSKDPSKDPARLAAAREMFLAAGQDKGFETVIKTMMQGMAAQVAQQKPGHAKEIAEIFDILVKKFLARKNEAVEMTAPLYAERFTVDELHAITAFYKSPIGAKLVREQPDIVQKSIRFGMVWGKRIGQEAVDEVRRELKKRGIDL